MKIKLKIITILLIAAFQLNAQSKQRIITIGDLELTSGSKLENCFIGYRTFGKVNSDSSNIIIYPTWFAGSSEEIGKLVGKYAFIDTTKYFVIAIDALGNGISVSPSNYNKHFPDISINDMVNAIHILLTKQLKINHVYAAVGGSMGSFQVLQFAVLYPDYFDKALAYVCSPKLSSYDLLWINTQLNLIETSLKYGMTEKDIKKISDFMTALMAKTPDYYNENIKSEDFAKYLTSFDKEPSKVFTLENYVAQLKAIRDFDITKDFNNSFEETIKNIKCKMFFIVNKTDMMVNPNAAIKFAELSGSKILILNNNSGHLGITPEIEKCREAVAKFLAN
jgi:homoserine O-acetyltransferase